MFKDANVLKNEGVLDVDIMEMYITENLNGVIGEEYKNVAHRITFTDGKYDEFSDLTTEYAQATKFVLDNGFMTGVTENNFAPEQTLN